MSEGIEEQCPDGGGSNPDPEQLTYQQENPRHEASNKQGKGSIDDQLLNAIGMDNAKKDQKATNPLLKHKENKPENTKLGTKTAQSKVTKNANRQQQKMNPTLLTSASAEDWFETMNRKESLIRILGSLDCQPGSSESRTSIGLFRMAWEILGQSWDNPPCPVHPWTISPRLLSR
jgi:hypothetical protein